MAKLSISADQASAVTASQAHLEDAFATGTVVPPATPVLPPTPLYKDIPLLARLQIKWIYQSFIAAILDVLNIRRPLPNSISPAVSTAKLTGGGTDGSLVFVDGMLISKTDPT